MDCSSIITERRHKDGSADPDPGILIGGVSLSGVGGPEADDRGALVVVACLSPLWLVLGHNALDVAVGFVWLFFADDGAAGEEVTIRQDHRPYGYQLASMLCFLIFVDNLLRRIEGQGESAWCWLGSADGS